MHRYSTAAGISENIQSEIFPNFLKLENRSFGFGSVTGSRK